MDYPRMPEQLDNRKKMLKSDIESLIFLRGLGNSIKFLAKKFDISTALVYYHLGGEKKRERGRISARERLERNKENVEFIEQRRITQRKYAKRKRKISPDFNKYVVENSKKWYSSSPENRAKWRNYSKIWRTKTQTKNVI